MLKRYYTLIKKPPPLQTKHTFKHHDCHDQVAESHLSRILFTSSMLDIFLYGWRKAYKW